jgi:uncharacterized glyoxalase superfamily protein PhnB
VWRGFCAVCGTSITYRHEEKPAEIDVALASLDDPEECHLWLEDKPSWVHISDGLPQYARSRAEGATAIARVQRPGYTAVTARIVHEDAAGLVAFIQQVFGAQGQYLPGVPAELRIGDTLLLVSEALASGRARKSAFLYVYVSDIEVTHRRALELGARELEAPLDTPYGDRRSMIEDVWGNTWQIARYVSSGAARA